jgi:hypothetical protein
MIAVMRMLVAVGAAIALLGLTQPPTPRAVAKGDNYIVGLTVSGGTPDPHSVSFAMLANDDDMFETQPPATGAATLTYDVIIHYDFKGYGGKRDWSGKFDGADLLYFPQSMIVGPGTWAAGWYQASPPLAAGLHAAMSSTALPNGGSGDIQTGAGTGRTAWLAGMVALMLALGGVYALARGLFI